MNSVEQSTVTSKRPRGDAATTSSAMLAAEETFMDLTIVVDLASVVEDVDPTVAPPLSLHAMMRSIMTTQATYGQLLDELLAEVASLRANFRDYRSSFPPPPPVED